MMKNACLYAEDPDGTKLDEFDYDLIIVGSGIAGLSAAYNIIKKNCGISILILEGSDKIGGRLGISGATRGYFIDDRQTHINNLISELGLKAVYRREIDNEKRIYYSRNGPVAFERKNDKMFDEIDAFINRLDLTAKCIDLKTYADYPEAKRLAKMNLEALIKNFVTDLEARELMKAIAYAICGVDPASVSALWFIVMAIGAGGLKRRIKFALGNNRRQFVPNGADKILEKLLEFIDEDRIKILTNSIVDLIEFNDFCTYVSVRDGEEYKCEYVIVAVPPPENSKIRISPERKDILRNQKSHEFGKGTFFLAIYDEAWWLGDSYSGDIFSSENTDCGFRLIYEASSPTESSLSPIYLAGFLNGTLKKSIDHPLDALRRCWPHKRLLDENNQAILHSRKFKSYTEWKWPGENERTGINQGGYPMSFMKPSNIKNHINPMLMPHKRVYWACSEYARYWPGTLDGAVESGEYAARSIIFQLRPQSLNGEELRFITPDTVAAAAAAAASASTSTSDATAATLSLKNRHHHQLPLDLVALHFFTVGIVTAILIVYCKPVK